MSYTYRLFFSVDEIDFDDWYSVPGVSDNALMQDGFLRTVEISMRSSTRCCFAIFYDRLRMPIACACYAVYIVDGAALAPAGPQRAIQSVQKLIPPFFKFNVLLCGLPVSTGASNLAIDPSADMPALTRALDAAACQLARQFRAVFIAFKEFDPDLAERLRPMTDLGYLRATSVITYVLEAGFESFDDYYQSRTKRTRANMRKVLQKFDDAGLRVEFLQGRDRIDEVFTEQVHALYLNVFRRSDAKFEVVPPEFFRELARQLPDQSRFTVLYRGSEVVAFACGVQLNADHINLIYCGINYDLNASADLYFNTLYKALDHSFQNAAQRIFVGQSADEFKQRLGCAGSPRYIFVKALGRIRSAIFRRVFPLVFQEPDFSKLHPIKPAAQIPETEPQPSA